MSKISETLTVLNGVTATTTSQVIDVSGWKRISLQVIRADHVAGGSSAFSITVSNDNVNYKAYNMLIDNVVNANTETLTRVASKTLSSNTNSFLFFDDFIDFKYIKVTVTETLNGTHSAILHIDYV